MRKNQWPQSKEKKTSFQVMRESREEKHIKLSENGNIFSLRNFNKIIKWMGKEQHKNMYTQWLEKVDFSSHASPPHLRVPCSLWKIKRQSLWAKYKIVKSQNSQTTNKIKLYVSGSSSLRFVATLSRTFSFINLSTTSNLKEKRGTNCMKSDKCFMADIKLYFMDNKLRSKLFLTVNFIQFDNL